MNIRANRYNDPALGAAFENIASLFAPPSAQDTAAYATAAAKKQEADRLAALWDNPTDPLAAARSSLLGIQQYGQTPEGFKYKVNADNSVTLQTNAADNARAIQTNLADNQRATITSLYASQAPGYYRPAVPGNIAGVISLPELPAVQGLPKPLSETEQLALERQQLRDSGTLTDTMLLDGILGDNAPVKTVGPDGKPIYSTPGAAARTGAQAYAGSAPKPENGMAVLRDGTSVPAIQNVTTGRWMHAQTGVELPPDIQVYKTPAPVGSNEQIGVGKPVANGIDRQLIDVAVAKDTAIKLRNMIATAPASQGAVGWLRGTTQNVIATGGELGQFFGGGVAEVAQAIESGAADASLAGAFDPNIPAIEMMANLLAFQYAKTTTGERLSNEMLRAARAALGLEGLTANQASSLARIDTAIKQMESQEEILRRIRTNGVGAGQATPPVAPTAPPSAAGATKMRFDAEGNLIP